eukprot:6484876-Amphidinium_carterae.2
MITRACRRKLSFFFIFGILCCIGWGEQLQHKTPLTHLWVLAGVVSEKSYYDLGSLRCSNVSHLVCTPLAEHCMHVCDKMDNCSAITYYNGWGDCQLCLDGTSLQPTRIGKTFQHIGACLGQNTTGDDECSTQVSSAPERLVYYMSATLITVLWSVKTIATFPLYFWPLCREAPS